MITNFYVHERETFEVAGTFDSKKEAYLYLEKDLFKQNNDFRDKKEYDFVVDKVILSDDKKYFLLYHVTQKQNLDSILEQGLIPQIGERATEIGEQAKGIYVFPSIEDLENAMDNWLGESFVIGCNCESEVCSGDCEDIEVPLTYLEIQIPYDEYVHHINTEVDYERVIKKTVLPKYIKVLDENSL